MVWESYFTENSVLGGTLKMLAQVPGFLLLSRMLNAELLGHFYLLESDGTICLHSSRSCAKLKAALRIDYYMEDCVILRIPSNFSLTISFPRLNILS